MTSGRNSGEYRDKNHGAGRTKEEEKGGEEVCMHHLLDLVSFSTQACQVRNRSALYPLHRHDPLCSGVPENCRHMHAASAREVLKVGSDQLRISRFANKVCLLVQDVADAIASPVHWEVKYLLKGKDE